MPFRGGRVVLTTLGGFVENFGRMAKQGTTESAVLHYRRLYLVMTYRISFQMSSKIAPYIHLLYPGRHR